MFDWQALKIAFQLCLACTIFRFSELTSNLQSMELKGDVAHPSRCSMFSVLCLLSAWLSSSISVAHSRVLDVIRWLSVLLGSGA